MVMPQYILLAVVEGLRRGDGLASASTDRVLEGPWSDDPRCTVPPSPCEGVLEHLSRQVECPFGRDGPGLDIVIPIGILNHMVLDRSPRLDLVFHALAHPARRAIIRQLSGGECNLSELASPLRMTFPAATKHVRVLERAKLVRRRVAGRQHLCRLRAAPLRDAMRWTEQFRQNWEARFEALDSLLDDMKSEEQSRSRRR